MELKSLFRIVVPVLAIAGCRAPDERDASEASASAYIGTTATVPPDGVCTHVVVTRLADFAVSEYEGLLAGGVFSVLPGESRVTATAFALPCTAEPSQPRWVADPQITTFSSGANTVMLHFREATSVVIDPTFDDNDAPQIALRPGSPFRTGRNGEDAAGPDFALDGWDIQRIALPPAAPSATLVFSTQGKGGLTGTPRGLAAMPNGSFVVQLTPSLEPLRHFDATGDTVELWSVRYPPGTTPFDATDGIEAIDATHLVRTGQLANPIACDADGANCKQSGIEILEIVARTDGSHEAQVTRQLYLPETADHTLNLDYPLAVTPVGSGFAVVSIPGDGTAQVMTLLDATGAITAGPVAVTGDIEGLFLAADGRLAALDYHGQLAMYDAATLTPRTGETAVYHAGIDLSVPFSLAWNAAGTNFLALTQENRLVAIAADRSRADDVGIDMSIYFGASGLDVRSDTGEILIADRLPPVDPIAHTRVPAVDVYDPASKARTARIVLRAIPLPARTLSIAYVPGRQQIVSNHHRPGGARDAALDGVVFTHGLDGSPIGSFDLAPHGFPVVQQVNYVPATDELVITARDAAGVERLVVTSPAGVPRRSYRLDAIGDVIDLAPITSGPAAGDFGAVESQPSNFFQLSLQ